MGPERLRPIDALRAIRCDLDFESGEAQALVQRKQVVLAVLNAENLDHRGLSFPGGAPRMTDAQRGNSVEYLYV
jgi:hypothetical protein